MSQSEDASFKDEKLCVTCLPMPECITSNQRIGSIVLRKIVHRLIRPTESHIKTRHKNSI